MKKKKDIGVVSSVSEQFTFNPVPALSFNLELVEYLASKGKRVAVMEPNAFNDLYQKYGSEEVLLRYFEENIGYMDEVQQVRDMVQEVANELGAKMVEGSFYVLDNKGVNGAIRAYFWPYIGIQFQLESTNHVKGAQEALTKKLNEKGIDIARIADIETNPGARTQRGATTAVFIGK